jgi:hypothetical protein
VRQKRRERERRKEGRGEGSTSYGAVYYLGKSACQLSLWQSSYSPERMIQEFVVLVQQPIAAVQHM